MAFKKGQVSNPTGRNGKGELPDRESVLRLLWRAMKSKDCPPQLVQGCKVLLEALPPPVVEGVTLRNSGAATPSIPVPAQPSPEPSLGDLLVS